MKKILFALCILFGMYSVSFAQQDSVEQYCEMAISRSIFGQSVSAKIIYGKNSLIISSDQVKEKKEFPTLPDALNYMGALGWKLVTTNEPQNDSGDWRFIFKKLFVRKRENSAGK
ncbi:hypothetical protein KHS38_16680 [Mucilaginibacter sp. Bleaf8]|uniref:hypothetical protein n=1 Tax=Mucilaginibacter sp. Bleaf8 TaxID=2834430 RepID=UPI001BD1547C|nr:hypothetical protein [Mucilaginibacter sp. Bleaf8]MBS7566045.1 hypothetical protein [Mucilaginibacter sp. Bleaf8]